MKKILVKTDKETEEVQLPFYSSELAAGADLRAYIQEPILLKPGQAKLISTGIKMEIPDGYEVQIRPRSGLALKYGVTVLNSPGTIDADYRGIIGVILINHGLEPFLIEKNIRIAQLVLAPVVQASFSVKEKLSKTLRGEGGFGHTGLS
jgi:dUTP pyrophosphatase